MEAAYYLIVEQPVGSRRLRTLDDYVSAAKMVSDAADYEAGEFAGRWVGALELQFDSTGRLTKASLVEDLGGQVRAELSTRSAWRRAQASRERWASR